ncbi:MAG: ABC transporter ATP-binding protein [Clostridiales bacterium]|nr:ABC transporter ATP-binding protein [Clostridiales bacterium]
MIEVRNLTKRYGSHLAVSDLSFDITPGKIYGFLGPNGAGKSTTMNIMTGCLAATSGDVKVGGYDIFEQPREAKSLIGYLPEMPPLYMDQTAEEYLYFVARAKGLKKKEIEAELDRVIEETHIENVSGKLIKHLSKGYRQRVGIAQALIGNPEVIILDEPTVGLDPAQIIEIRDLIKTLGEKHTVILSSHILSEVQAICDEVLIIHQGKLVAFDKMENLGKTLSSGNTVEICCEASAKEVKKILRGVDSIESVNVTEENGETCNATVHVGEADPKEVCREISFAFANAGKILLQLNPVKANLEDVFMEITKMDDVSGDSAEAGLLSDVGVPAEKEPTEKSGQDINEISVDDGVDDGTNGKEAE